MYSYENNKDNEAKNYQLMSMEESNHNSQFSTLNSQLDEFKDIRPYEPEEMKQAFNDLLNDRQFNLIMKGFAPWLPKFLDCCDWLSWV